VRGWQINATARARPWPWEAGVLKENTLLIYHHHHISVMELGHLLTRSGLTYPEVSSKVCHDSFCQLGNRVSLPWVIYYEAFYLHVASSFSCIPVVCLKLVLFLIPFAMCVFVLQSVPSVSCCSSHVFHLCCCYSSGVPSKISWTYFPQKLVLFLIHFAICVFVL